MLKVITLIGTRPELIKLSLVLEELDRHTKHVMVHSGQNHDFELNEVFFRDLGIRKPDHFLSVAGGTAAAAIARVIERFDEVLETEKPDAMLILGDTNSCLGVIPAKRRKIPIFHMEAGNRCFDQRVPEEINRRIIDHTSDINLVYSEHARRNLLAEGLRADTVMKTGSPMLEVLERFKDKIHGSDVLARLQATADELIIVSAHREENVDKRERLTQLMATLDAVGRQTGKRIIFSAHPRTRVRLNELGISMPERVELMKPLGFFDYIKLQKSAFCVLSDSGTLTEESAILGFPAVMLREAHERPEGMDEGTVVMTTLDPDAVLASIALVRAHRESGFRLPPDYAPSDVSRKVVRIILSYTSFVRRTVWHEA